LTASGTSVHRTPLFGKRCSGESELTCPIDENAPWIEAACEASNCTTDPAAGVPT
jgi:hypothetical protein